MNDDDLVRQALREPTEPTSSYRVLQDLRPTMRRARTRRRLGVGAATAVLLAGAGAGVLALTSASSAPTVRTTPASDENGAAATTLPIPPEAEENTDGGAPEPVVVPPTVAAPIPGGTSTTSAPEDHEQIDVPQAPPTTRSPVGVPAPAVPATPTTTPPATQAVPTTPPPTTASSSSQVLTSACGEVVVAIDGQSVRIASIAPLAGYTAQVATDGPESVEVTFRGADRNCEVHAERKADGLDVEIQDSDDD
ncbi:MAG: hypothetical protein ACM3MM_08325 [Acidobacteriota bacterium]